MSEKKRVPGSHPKANPECEHCGGMGWVLEPSEANDPKLRYVACDCTRSDAAGDVVIGLLVGLALGIAALVVTSGNEAQNLANLTGRDVSPMEVITEQPGKSALVLFGPAVAGAGVGWALQEMSGGDSASRDNTIRIDGNQGDINVNIRGDGGDSSSSSTSTRTDTRTDTRTNQ